MTMYCQKQVWAYVFSQCFTNTQKSQNYGACPAFNGSHIRAVSHGPASRESEAEPYTYTAETNRGTICKDFNSKDKACRGGLTVIANISAPSAGALTQDSNAMPI